MAKFMCTHTMSGVSQEMYSWVATAGQKEPNIKLLQSFANLTEGKIYCVWQSPNPEEVTAWFKKMNVPPTTASPRWKWKPTAAASRLSKASMPDRNASSVKSDERAQGWGEPLTLSSRPNGARAGEGFAWLSPTSPQPSPPISWRKGGIFFAGFADK